MIAVAGSGVIGLACAFRLAQRGERVTLFEAGDVAREASWAAAGMLAPGGEFEHDTSVARMALASLRAYPDFVAEVTASSGLSIDYCRCGALSVAYDDPEAEALNRRAALQDRIGIRSEVSTHLGRFARLYPDDALVDPRALTRALRMACERRGVLIHERLAVEKIESHGRAVRTEAGLIGCDAVLIAAGVRSADLHSSLPAGIPLRGHLIGWREPVPEARTPVLRNGQTYIVQRGNGLVVAGSSMENRGFDRTIDEKSVSDIKQRVARLLPGAPPPEVEVWNGIRPALITEEPFIGRIAGTNIFAAYGHGRNGILLAPETASRIGALMLGS